MPRPAAPVLVVVQPPGLAVSAREEQPFADSVSQHVFTHVAAHWIEEVDRAWVETAHLLSADDLAVNVPLLDEQGVAPHVPHLECQQLLGGPKSLVGDE